MVRTIEIFIASPGDVAPERKCVKRIAADLNRNLGRANGVRFEVRGWDTDTRPRSHCRGPQGPIGSTSLSKTSTSSTATTES